MKKYLRMLVLSSIFFIISCKFLDVKSKGEHKKNNIVSDCDTVKKIISKFWFYSKDTTVYRSTNLKIIEQVADLYPSCFAKSSNLSSYWIQLLGKPSEGSENEKGYFWVYYAENDCLTFRKKGEFGRCNCYFISLNKLTNRISAKEGVISANP